MRLRCIECMGDVEYEAHATDRSEIAVRFGVHIPEQDGEYYIYDCLICSKCGVEYGGELTPILGLIEALVDEGVSRYVRK